jgi:serine/threonine-protein kinase
MLTGARLFEGDTDSDILLAVMQEDPDWQVLPPGTPPAVRRLLRRCLERDPSKRLHDVADARLELEDAITQPESASAEEAPPTLRARARAAWPVMLSAVAIGAVLAGATVWKLSANRIVASGSPVRVSLNLPPDTLLEWSWDWSLAILPDGRSLFFSGNKGGKRQLYKRDLDQFEAIPIPGTENGVNPFPSPNGRWLGFFTRGKLKKVPLAGGTPQIIADAPGSFGATWGADGSIIFVPEVGQGLWRVPASGGRPEVLLRPDFDAGESDLFWPELLPDGRAVLFTAWRGFTAETTEIGVLDLESRQRRTLIENGSRARYVASGHLIFGRGGRIFVAPFDVERRAVTGPPVPVPEHIAYIPDLGIPHLAVSDGGRLAFIPGGGPAPRLRLVSVDLEGRETPLTETRRAYMYPRFSPDGERLAVTILDPGDINVWVLDLLTGTQTKLTLESESIFPLWTPDGERVAFASYRGGEIGIYWKKADGDNEAELLVSSDHAGELLAPSSWSPDGKMLAYWKFRVSEHEPGQYDLWITDIDGDREPRPLVATEAQDFGAAISPDGRWLAYVSDVSGRSEIFVQPFPQGGERRQITTDEGEKPIWSPDGRTVYFTDAYYSGRIMAVPVSTMPRFQSQAPRTLLEPQRELAGYRGHPNFDIAPDGKSFVMIKSDEEWGRTSEIRVILNWFEELERLAPATGIR